MLSGLSQVERGPPNALCTSDLSNKDPNMAREIPNSTIHVNIICTLFPPSTYQQDPFKKYFIKCLFLFMLREICSA